MAGQGGSKAKAIPSYWEDVIAYYATSSELKDWIQGAEGHELVEFQKDFLDTLSYAFAYQGFDPLRVITLMRKSYEAYMSDAVQTNLPIEFTEKGQPKTFNYTNVKTMKEDIQLLLILFAMRGSSWEKIKKKANKGMSELLETLKEKYDINIQVNKANTSLAPDIVTLPRIAGCFPSLLCLVYHKGAGKLIVRPSDLDLSDSISKAILTPFFTSCIPPTWIKKDAPYHILFFLVHVVLDDVLHKVSGKKTDLERIYLYYVAAYHSPAFPTKARAAFCASIGLGNSTNDAFCQAIKTAADFSEAKLSDLRPDDKGLGDVIKQLKALD